MQITIIHFQALEQYPPIMNVLNTFGKENKTLQMINVVSTKSTINSSYKFSSKNVNIARTTSIMKSDNGLIRVLKYFWFNLFSLFQLILQRPDSILYYETISAFPAIFYKKYINRSCNLMAHYHEYTTIQEYQTGSGFVFRIWNFEKYNFELIDIVSHTNAKRMELFKADYPNTTFKRTMILPNYPPKSWSELSNDSLPEHPIRLVYIGALSLETTYLKEICDWVVKQDNQLILDFYTSNITDSAKDYLNTITNRNIKLRGGLNYFDIPNILKDYHVGLILYKGHIPNYIHNAPNKLFEYLAVGLDVWFPDTIEGSKSYITTNQYPKVISLDFDNLKTYAIDDLIEKKGFIRSSNTYNCEPIYEDFYNILNAIN